MPKDGVAGIMSYEKYKMDCRGLRPRNYDDTLKKTEPARDGTRRGSLLGRTHGTGRTKRPKLQGAERDAAVHRANARNRKNKKTEPVRSGTRRGSPSGERTEQEEQKDRNCEERNATRQSIGADCKIGHFTSFVISIISDCRGLICFEAAKRISNGFYNVFFKDKEERITLSTIYAVSYKRVLFKHKKTGLSFSTHSFGGNRQRRQLPSPAVFDIKYCLLFFYII